MADSIFDGCIAASQGLQACDCRYCTYIKSMPAIVWPAGYPPEFKDLRAVKFLQQEDKVKEHDARIQATEADITKLKAPKA